MDLYGFYLGFQQEPRIVSLSLSLAGYFDDSYEIAALWRRYEYSLSIRHCDHVFGILGVRRTDD